MKTQWVASEQDLKEMEKVFRERDPENRVVYKDALSFDVFLKGALIARVKISSSEGTRKPLSPISEYSPQPKQDGE